MATSEYHFNISLNVLNHLGRNLYRNFITILGEAISNCWDADAENIEITLDRKNDRLIITDDGEGMSSSDFKNKFLLVGYSKRGTGNTHSPNGRPYIGRKGIGKLALLSCAKKISIYTKKDKDKLTGGTIDNDALDAVLNSEDTAQEKQFDKEYPLGMLDSEETHIYEKKLTKGHGTVLVFERLNPKVSSNVQLLKSQIALYFRFSLLQSKLKFEISFNGKLVSVEDLKQLAVNTQFVWKNKGFKDPYLDLLKSSLLEDVKEIDTSRKDLNIQFEFFIASVTKPSNLNIHGTGEKTGIDLFVNGRLRENNIMRRHKVFSTHISSSYLYGQIHCNFLDDGGPDRFTSSREGVLDGDDKYPIVLAQLESILAQIRIDWKALRTTYRQIGEPDESDPLSDKKAIYARNIFETVLAEIAASDNISDKDRKKLVASLRKAVSTPGEKDIEINISEYTQLFIIENYLRYQIEPSTLPDDLNTVICERRCEDRQQIISDHGGDGTTNKIRHDMEGLEYLSLRNLTSFLKLKKIVARYIPIRNAVAHTGKLTKYAKKESRNSYKNIIAAILKREKARPTP